MWKKFIAYYKPYIGLFSLDLLCAFFIAGIDLTYPLISKYALNTLLPADAFKAFYAWMIILVAAYLIKGALQFFVTYQGHMLGVYMETDMRRDLFSHLQKLSFRFYDKNRTGSLMSRVVSDLFEVVELAHHGPEDLFISLVTLIGAVIIMFTIRWELALVITLLVPLLIGFTIMRRTYMGSASRKVKEKLAVINSDIESSISGVRTAKAFANEEYELNRFQRGSIEYRTARNGFFKQMGIFGAGSDIITNLINVAVVAAGGLLIIGN